MVGETRLAPKMSVAVRTRDLNPCQYTRRARHAFAKCLVASERDIAMIPLATRSTYISFGHGVKMKCHLVIQQDQSFGCFDLPFKHVITI